MLNVLSVPGKTKEQLAAEGADKRKYKWCPGCKLYWHKRGYAAHQGSELHTGDIVDIFMPPTSIPLNDRVSMIHPGLAPFISALADLLIKDLTARPPRTVDRKEPCRGSARSRRRKSRLALPSEESDRETVTVDEAIRRFGLSREEIIEQFAAAERTAAERWTRRTKPS